MTGIYYGSSIKDLKGRHQKITRTQTAAQAYSAIISKYGSISDTERYYHTGKGVWKKYSLENDKKRTGKIADTKEEWQARPHKFDWPGVDTKEGQAKKAKRSFSVGMLKNSARLSGRKSKQLPNFSKKVKVKTLFVTAYDFKTGQINDREEAAVYQAMNSGNLDSAKKRFIKVAQHQMKDARPDDPRIEAAYKRMQKIHAERMLAESRKEYKIKQYFGSRMAFYNYYHSLYGDVDRSIMDTEWNKKVVGNKFKVENIRQPGMIGRKNKSNPKIATTSVVKHVSENGKLIRKVKVKKPQSLKEINIRLDELKKVYEPIYRENRKPTSKEAEAIKEANTLIRKRDGILKRSETNAQKKKEKESEKLLQSATAKAAEARGKAAKQLSNKAVLENASKIGKSYSFLVERKDGSKEHGSAVTLQSLVQSVGNRSYYRENPIVRIGVYQKDGELAYLKSFPAYKEPVMSSKPSKVYWMHGKKPDSMKTIAEKIKLSQLKPPSKLSRRTKKVAPRASKEPVVKKIAAAGKYRYASFNRPLWAGFNPGVPFKLERVTASDKDFRYNRAPHSVISTGTKLSEETLKKFELTDLAEGRKMKELIAYVNKHDFLNDSMKEQLKRLILKGKSKEEIDRYIEKGRKITEKKVKHA